MGESACLVAGDSEILSGEKWIEKGQTWSNQERMRSWPKAHIKSIKII